MARQYPEHQLCQAIMNYWRAQNPSVSSHLFHIPNEGKMSHRAGARLNHIGRRKGVADYCCIIPSGRYSQLWMEVKCGSNSPDDAQLQFLHDARIQGAAAVVVWTIDEATSVLSNWMNDTPDNLGWMFETDTRKLRTGAYKAGATCDRTATVFG